MTGSTRGIRDITRSLSIESTDKDSRGLAENREDIEESPRFLAYMSWLAVLGFLTVGARVSLILLLAYWTLYFLLCCLIQS